MNNIIPAICAIEQEMKYMGNSEEGSRQFRKGYLRALKIVREFLNFQKPDSVLLRTPSCSAVARLLSALSQEQGVVHTRPAVISIDEKVSPELSVPNPLEAKALEIALGVLRSNTDYGDFLNFWLHEYGKRILSSDPPDPLLPEISTEEELALRVQDAPFHIH